MPGHYRRRQPPPKRINGYLLLNLILLGVVILAFIYFQTSYSRSIFKEQWRVPLASAFMIESLCQQTVGTRAVDPIAFPAILAIVKQELKNWMPPPRMVNLKTSLQNETDYLEADFNRYSKNELDVDGLIQTCQENAPAIDAVYQEAHRVGLSISEIKTLAETP